MEIRGGYKIFFFCHYVWDVDDESALEWRYEVVTSFSITNNLIKPVIKPDKPGN